MRDLSQDSSLLSINSMTVKPWSLEQLIEGCARAGISAISPWRDIVQACGLERAAKLISAHGMTVTGLCRGGMFPAADDAGRRAALDDNRRAVDEAAAIGAQCLILVVGGLPKGSRDIAYARRQVRDAHDGCVGSRQRWHPVASRALEPTLAPDPVQAFDDHGETEDHRRIAQCCPSHRPDADLFDIDELEPERNLDEHGQREPPTSEQQRGQDGADPASTLELIRPG